jgi:hypothetical protein
VKRRALERWLRQQNAVFHHHGGSHDVWWTAGPTGGQFATVPRHREIKRYTALKICQQLSVPPPPELR